MDTRDEVGVVLLTITPSDPAGVCVLLIPAILGSMDLKVLVLRGDITELE